MALIAFCAIALVENVTNAHPAGGRRGDGSVGRGGKVGSGEKEEEEEGRRERTKNKDKRVTRTSLFCKKQRAEQEVENNNIFLSQSTTAA